MPERSDETHFVLIIHGTFAAPQEGVVQWYEPDPANPESFCSRLETELAGTPLAGAVWRSFERTAIFSWSGENDHRARIEAGRRLADLLWRVALETPTARIHLVAHSHGGNVALHAIGRYLHRLSSVAQKAVGTGRSDDVRARLAAAADIEPAAVPEPWVRVSEQARHEMDWHTRRMRGQGSDDTLGLAMARLAGFGQLWTKSPETNRLGRVVFLGTPFLRKRWLRRGSRAGRGVDRLLRAAPTLPWLALLAGLMVYAGWWVAAATPWAEAPPLDPRAWGTAPWAVAGLLAAGLLLAVAAMGRRRDRNLYLDLADTAELDEVQDYVAPAVAKIPALVVTADLLDEALLGLSAEPIAQAVVLPRVAAILEARPGPVADDPIVGDENELIAWLRRLNARAVRAAARALYLLALPIWWPLRTLLLQPLVRRTVTSALKAAAFGLDAEQMRSAEIGVSGRLEMPQVFKALRWNIAGALLDAGGEAAGERAARAAARSGYEHLTNEELLERRLASLAGLERHPWQAIEKALPALYRRQQRAFAGPAASGSPGSLADYREDMGRRWLTLERRLQELSGFHSAYYSEAWIVEAIGGFLVSGRWPRGVELENLRPIAAAGPPRVIAGLPAVGEDPAAAWGEIELHAEANRPERWRTLRATTDSGHLAAQVGEVLMGQVPSYAEELMLDLPTLMQRLHTDSPELSAALLRLLESERDVSLLARQHRLAEGDLAVLLHCAEPEFMRWAAPACFAVFAARLGHPELRQPASAHLDRLEKLQGWQPVAARLRQLLAGDSPEPPAEGAYWGYAALLELTERAIAGWPDAVWRLRRLTAEALEGELDGDYRLPALEAWRDGEEGAATWEETAAPDLRDGAVWARYFQAFLDRCRELAAPAGEPP